MDMDTPTGNAAYAGNHSRNIAIPTLATDGTLRTGHPLDDHEFCPKCGFCVECEDCAIWGCGKET